MSLRRQLILGVAAVVALVGLAVGTVGGIEMYGEVEELLDQELVQIAYMAERAEPPNQRGPGPLVGSRYRDGELAVQRWKGDMLIRLLPTRVRLPRPEREGFDYVDARGTSWRRYAVRIEGGWVIAAQRTDARYELTAGAVAIAVLPVLFGLPLVGLFIAMVVRRTLAPLHQITSDLKARPALSAEPLDAKGVPDEVRPLLDAFNGLLERVRAGVEREHTFITDAAHALRTPVTALQLQAETLAGATSAVDYEERLADLIAGITRARHTLEQLLALARAGHHPAGRVVVREVLDALLDTFHTALRQRRVSLQREFNDIGDACVPLRAEALTIVLQNLFDNALRYSPPGATITVGACREGEWCRIWVRDQGPGLPAEDLERVYERFYRSVNDTTAGTGLGLSIVQAIVSAAHGTTQLARGPAGTGLTATLLLPVIETAS